jgi:hypothetical protein
MRRSGALPAAQKRTPFIPPDVRYRDLVPALIGTIGVQACCSGTGLPTRPSWRFVAADLYMPWFNAWIALCCLQAPTAHT